MFNPSDCIVVKRSKGRGLGVFASKDIPAGAVIERSPVILIPNSQITDDHVLNWYVYGGGRKSAVGLGYLSLYNHSKSPNAFSMDDGQRAMSIIAKHAILTGHEVLIDYGPEYDYTGMSRSST